MTFKEAVELVGQIQLHLGWLAEIDASSSEEGAIIIVSARYERSGLVYNAEIEHPSEWPVHQQRLQNWHQRGITDGD